MSQIDVIKSTITDLLNSVPYNSLNSTLIHKNLMYNSFINVTNEYPEEMSSYLVELKRGNKLQHKIFQEYIRLLEQNIPFSFKKKNEVVTVNSLLDDELSIFDGISNFDTIVNNKQFIKNNTKEYYIGGRSAAYFKPFFIGKLLDVIDLQTSNSIKNDVSEYSFSKIKMKTTKPGTPVKIIHLRIPPHYQMGGMIYLNRARREIVDNIYLTLNGQKRNPSR